MPAALYDIESLVSPLAGDAPCGPELDHDADFQRLEHLAAGVPERQYGGTVYPAEPPDWQQVFDLALALAQRTRDLRLAIWLARSGAHLLGMPGAARGLQFVLALVEQQWPLVHPQLDASDGNDPTMRLNALSPLTLADAALADLRAAAVVARRGSLTLRELELGLSKAEAHGNEARPTEAGVLQGLAALLASDPEAGAALRAAAAAAAALAVALDVKAGSAAPDIAPLRKLLAVGTGALDRLASWPGTGGAATAADGAVAAAAPAAADGEMGGGSGNAGGGAIRSRADAARELDRISQWLERHEPGHPAPLLIRRAQRLMNMSFIEIIQDMAPGGFDQVQAIAGAQPE